MQATASKQRIKWRKSAALQQKNTITQYSPSHDSAGLSVTLTLSTLSILLEYTRNQFSWFNLKNGKTIFIFDNYTKNKFINELCKIFRIDPVLLCLLTKTKQIQCDLVHQYNT